VIGGAGHQYGPRRASHGQSQPIDPASVKHYLAQSSVTSWPTRGPRWKALAKHTHQTTGGSSLRLYEQFRPKIPEGKKGWGAAGQLDLDHIRLPGRRKIALARLRPPLYSKDSQPFRPRCARKPERSVGCKAPAPCPGWRLRSHRGGLHWNDVALNRGYLIGLSLLKSRRDIPTLASSVITVTVFLLYFTQHASDRWPGLWVNVTRSRY